MTNYSDKDKAVIIEALEEKVMRIDHEYHDLTTEIMQLQEKVKGLKLGRKQRKERIEMIKNVIAELSGKKEMKEEDYEVMAVIEPSLPKKVSLTKIGSLRGMPIYEEIIETLQTMFGGVQVAPRETRTAFVGYYPKANHKKLAGLTSHYLLWMAEEGFAEKIKRGQYRILRRKKEKQEEEEGNSSLLHVQSTYVHWTPTPKEELGYDLNKERQHGVCPNCGNRNSLHKYKVHDTRNKCEHCEKEYLTARAT